MGYLAPNFEAQDTGAKADLAYGKINHVELDIPQAYCRLDVHWFSSKEKALEVRAMEVWSYVLTSDELNALLRSDIVESSTLGVAYTLIRAKDAERFANYDVQDDK